MKALTFLKCMHGSLEITKVSHWTQLTFASAAVNPVEISKCTTLTVVEIEKGTCAHLGFPSAPDEGTYNS